MLNIECWKKSVNIFSYANPLYTYISASRIVCWILSEEYVEKNRHDAINASFPKWYGKLINFKVKVNLNIGSLQTYRSESLSG